MKDAVKKYIRRMRGEMRMSSKELTKHILYSPVYGLLEANADHFFGDLFYIPLLLYHNWTYKSCPFELSHTVYYKIVDEQYVVISVDEWCAEERKDAARSPDDQHNMIPFPHRDYCKLCGEYIEY